MRDDLIPVRRMCEEYDVTPRTLRFYEDEGLLAPTRRGNTRWYCRGDRTRHELILRGKQYGLTINEIRDLMALYDPANGNVAQLRTVRATGRRQLALLNQRKTELDAAIDGLRQEIDAVSRNLDDPGPERSP